MPADFTWPRPWLLECYQRAVQEGCIRIRLRGPDFEGEFKSFKGAFHRLRRRKDGNFAVLMRPEFQFVTVKYEPEMDPPRILLIYSSLPDGQPLPLFESVEGKQDLPQPIGSAPPPVTPEAEPEDFDAHQHVAGLIDKLDIAEEDGDVSELG